MDPGSSVNSSIVATMSMPPSKISVKKPNARSIFHHSIIILLTHYLFYSVAEDENETKHLEGLEGAETRLRFFQIDLLDYPSILRAVNGCAGVFHLASPCIVDQVQDPQKQLLDPAIKGTINVLTAAKEAGVSRVVVTSSISSITPSPNWPADVVKAEDCWSDMDYCKQKEVSASITMSSFQQIYWTVMMCLFFGLVMVSNF